MEENKITQEQVDQINEVMNNIVESDEDLKAVSDLPSNNGIEEHEPEEGEKVKALVAIDPVTGEHIVQKKMDSEDEDFLGDDDLFDSLENVKLDDSPANINELLDVINSDNEFLKEISIHSENGFNLSDSSLRKVLEISNRKLKKENFNIFKELPVEVQEMITKYCQSGGVPLNTPNGNQFRNMVAENLIEEFVSNITFNRITHDMSTEIEAIFDNIGPEISEKAVDYSLDNERKYRELAEKIEDEDKRREVIAILDAMKEGFDLNNLKEYAKKCKIKRYELERPDKIFRDFVRKYKDSKQNVYSIESAAAVLLRHLNMKDGHQIVDDKKSVIIEYDKNKVTAFMIAFAKQTMNYKPENILEHAYIYYVLYNAMFTDINTGKNKEVSDKYLDNVKEVINNLVERNKSLFT